MDQSRTPIAFETAAPAIVLPAGNGASSWQTSSVIVSKGKTMSGSSVSTKSSSSSHADGSRDEMQEATVGGNGWTVTVTATDHYAANSPHALQTFSVSVRDASGTHPLEARQSYTSPTGAVFSTTENSAHVVELDDNGQREVTDIVRSGGPGSRIDVRHHN